MKIKHDIEIKHLLKDLFFESWMDDQDWEEFESHFFRDTGLAYEQLSEQIETGVTNGHSVENQINMLKQAWQQYQ